nr:3-deoxy-manno-octulosonate cytidylyltransferase [Spirochaetota bacterium]
FLKHYGIYGYSPQALEKFVELKPGKLEMIEKLEQLRWLENGNDIFVQKVDFDLISIDTREDIETFENYIKKTLCN